MSLKENMKLKIEIKYEMFNITLLSFQSLQKYIYRIASHNDDNYREAFDLATERRYLCMTKDVL